MRWGAKDKMGNVSNIRIDAFIRDSVGVAGAGRLYAVEPDVAIGGLG